MIKTQNSKFQILNSSFSRSGQDGYMALMSAIIIAGVLMAVVFTMGFKSFMTRFNLLDSEYKKVSLNMAEACANTAILKLIQDNSYAGGETITLNGRQCEIVSVTGTYQIRTKAYMPDTGSRRAVSNIEVTLDSGFSISAWKEVPNL